MGGEWEKRRGGSDLDQSISWTLCYFVVHLQLYVSLVPTGIKGNQPAYHVIWATISQVLTRSSVYSAQVALPMTEQGRPVEMHVEVNIDILIAVEIVVKLLYFVAQILSWDHACPFCSSFNLMSHKIELSVVEQFFLNLIAQCARKITALLNVQEM